MQATRAYIASAGTAAVMLGASLAMFVFVSAFVAFGSWPGSGSGHSVNQVLLHDVSVSNPKVVPVRSDAVKVAQRAELRQAIADAKAGRPHRAPRGIDGAPVVKNPARSAPGAATLSPTGTPVAAAPVKQAAGTVQQQAQNVTNQVTQTTKDLGTTVQQQTQNVTNQVNQVVDQVAGGVQQTTTGAANTVDNTVNQLGTTVTQTTGTVTGTVGGVLGH